MYASSPPPPYTFLLSLSLITVSSGVTFLQQMSERTFVVIFFFWAVLTILTPTLILLSESSKPALYSNVDKITAVTNDRRMMVYAEKQPRRELIPSAPMEAPMAAPVPELVSETRWSTLRRIFKKK
ncbi:uncharacterized protein LOC110615760 [Manihot esculenta]|uniref:Uncharacterized protein n=1 Tax=Manihot esculenta TaxID=3983 RepID=A0A2C9VWL1_MANES|nr:uncharacterized protein LOC110615760 [Manihot esculenta]OAY50706.1 hypothetical protein MANES_05G157800v8 [Manihot esculenta]